MPPRPLLVVLLVELLLATACNQDADRRASPPPVPATRPSVTGPGRPTAVPIMVGLEPASARKRLREAGLRVRVVSDVHQACDGRTAVAAQDPAPGHLPPGSRSARIVVPDPATTCDVPPRLRRVALRFVDLALGTGPGPDVAPGGATFLWGDRAPSAFSLVTDAVANDRPLVFSRRPPPVVCGPGSGSLPPRFSSLRRVSIAPARAVATCHTDGRVQLFLDRRYRVVAVELVLSVT